MARYELVEGSESRHCCFDYTIIDKESIWMTDSTGKNYYNSVGEFFDEDYAVLVLNALNGVEK